MTEAWPIKESNDFRRKVLEAGRYMCKLDAIESISVPTNPKFWDEEKQGPMPETQPKLLFVFSPISVQLEPDEDANITTMVTPSNGKKSNMFKLLCSLSSKGMVPEEIRADTARYQAFAESLIGSYFQVTSQPSANGKYNNLVQAVPVEPPDAALKKVMEEKSPEKPAILTGFESMPDIKTFVHRYDFSSLSGQQLERAIKFANQQNMCALDDERKTWSSVTEKAELKKFYKGKIEDPDDIPF